MKKTLKDIEKGINKPKANSMPRGIPKRKKEGIINSLCQLMPPQKQAFWLNLPECEESVDLTECGDVLIEEEATD